MKRFFVSAGMFLAALLPTSVAADQIDDIMVRVMAQAHIPGASIAIVREGRITKLRSYGLASIEYHAPVRADTPFQIASSGKIYTAVLLMRMVEQGLLKLDDPVTKFVPDAPAAWKKITVRNLASHMSGLSSVDIGPDSVSTLAAVRQAFAARVLAPPGQRASYDSFDYTLLQYILEKVGGLPYPELLRERVLTPAGMRCTYFDMAETRGPQRVAENVPGRAEYYRWTGSSNQRRWFMYAKFAYAAGGAYSCIADMAHLLVLLDGNTFLSAGSKALLEQPVALPGGGRAAFSVGLVAGSYRGRRWIGHSGGPAFADVMYFPDTHLGIAVFTNQQRLSPLIASLIADRYIAPRPIDLAAGLADPLPKLTANVWRLMEGAAVGHVDPSLIADAQREDYVADLDDAGPAWMGLLGPLTRIALRSDQPLEGQGRTRAYRIFYGTHTLDFTFEFAPDGRITGIRSRD